jgi:AcrR family transcriptional regulator
VTAPIKNASKRLPRRNLTRAKLIASALALIDKSGAELLTMRGLGAAVGVTPMALYNHFASKRALLTAVADSVIGAARFDGGPSEWRAQIHYCFATLRGLCLQHPGLPRLLEIEGAAPVTVFAPMDVTLRALRQAGLNDLDCTRTYFVLVSFTLAQTNYQTRSVPDLGPSGQVRTVRLESRGYDVVERMELPTTWDFDAAFDYGTSLILDGVEAIISETAAAGAILAKRSESHDAP